MRIVLKPSQIALLKTLVETEVECKSDIDSPTAKELVYFKELIGINRDLCYYGNLMETQTGIYQKCRRWVLNANPRKAE